MRVKTETRRQKGNAKIKILRQKIEALTKQLEDKEWASRKTNEGIKLLYKELEEKNKKLKKVDQLKSQFVANVAHEFKTPLVIAKECIDLVLEGSMGKTNPQQQEMLQRGLRTLERLIRLVTDLLDIARIESGKMTMNRSEIELAPFLEEIFAGFKGEFSKKEIAFKAYIPPTIGSIWADKDKINEVIINLLSNALKYTPKGGEVVVLLAGDEKKIRFEISNTGSRIPKKDLTKIFDKFERVTAEKEQGTGLGLPIARDIITLHKGRLWAESGSGKGCKFIFTLPRSLRKQKG